MDNPQLMSAIAARQIVAAINGKTINYFVDKLNKEITKMSHIGIDNISFGVRGIKEDDRKTLESLLVDLGYSFIISEDELHYRINWIK